MKATLRVVTLLLLTLVAVPSFGVEIDVNREVQRLTVDSCNDLRLQVVDYFSFFGFRQETYTVYRDSSPVASKVFSYFGFGSAVVVTRSPFPRWRAPTKSSGVASDRHRPTKWR